MGRDANRSYGMHGKKMPNVSNDDWQCFFFWNSFFWPHQILSTCEKRRIGAAVGFDTGNWLVKME